jgi:hypothetical protein
MLSRFVKVLERALVKIFVLFPNIRIRQSYLHLGKQIQSCDRIFNSSSTVDSIGDRSLLDTVSKIEAAAIGNIRLHTR